MKNERFGEGYSTEARYNTKAVVNETGVPADTFRAWERRYGTPMPYRTTSGQRLYSERDIAVVRWLRDRTAAGMTISQAVRLLASAQITPNQEVERADWPTLRKRLVEALTALDPASADSILAHAFARFSLDDVCLQLIEPSLVTIGERWHAGTLSIGQEHFASGFIRRKLHALLNVYDVVVGHTSIVAACVPGEHHDIGLLILVLALVRRGYRVVYLGADLPIQGLLPVVEQVKPALVCLSASTSETAKHIEPIARALHALPQAPIVVAGGQGAAQIEPSDRLYQLLVGNAVVAADQIGRLLEDMADHTSD